MLDRSTDASEGQQLPTHNGLARTGQKTLYLNGLRGVAALLVYMQHQTGYFYGHEVSIDLGFGAQAADGTINRHFASLPIIRLLYNGGSAAVAVFFVLSGYVLSARHLHLIQNGQHDKCSVDLKSAVVRRPFRLYLPIIAITLIFVIWLHLPFGFAPKVNIPIKQPGLFAEFKHCLGELVVYLNPFQQHGWFIAWFPYNGTLWTIPIELKGSILVFGLLAILNSETASPLRKYQMLFLLTLACGLLMIDQWSMSLFVFGILLSARDVHKSMAQTSSTTAQLDKYPRLRTIFQHALLLTALYLLSQPVKGQDVKHSSGTPGWYMLSKVIPPSYLKDEYYRFFHSLGAVMLVHSVLRLSWLQDFFSNKTLLYLGRISFSFYLIHIPVLWVYGDRAQRLLGVHGRNWNGPLWVDRKMAHLVPDIGPVGLSTRYVIAVWGIFPVVIGLSELSTRFVDEPSILFSRWVSSRTGIERSTPAKSTSTSLRRRSSAKSNAVLDRID